LDLSAYWYQRFGLPPEIFAQAKLSCNFSAAALEEVARTWQMCLLYTNGSVWSLTQTTRFEPAKVFSGSILQQMMKLYGQGFIIFKKTYILRYKKSGKITERMLATRM
jgi:hypothetical protein